MSAVLVPGRILRVDPSSSLPEPPRRCSASLPKVSPTEGDWGPIWTSVNGGGLGSRGELDGEAPAAVMARKEMEVGVGEAGEETRETESGKRMKGDSAPS